jgi:tetratricopeptide (TPR) repeat protein
MPRREAQDGGHTAFTDHRIERRPRKDDGPLPAIEKLRAWRETAPDLRARNFALALNDAGLRYSSASALVTQSYPLLVEVRKSFPNDPDVLMAIGTALMQGKQPLDAAKIFERALELHHDDVSLEDNAGTAWLDAGDSQAAARHFERALQLDSLLLPDIEALLRIYRQAGDRGKEASLMERVRAAMITRAARPTLPRR